MGIQVYITGAEQIDFQVVQVDENNVWMGEMQSLSEDGDVRVWSSGPMGDLEEEMIQLEVSQKSGQVILSCGFLEVCGCVKLINYTAGTVTVVGGVEEKREYRIESQRMRRFSRDELISKPMMSDSYLRRPAYWMRGKPVTREQAFEIIRRTDNYFSWYNFDRSEPKGFVSVYTIDSWWFDGHHYPASYGWCRPDGRIGLDSITQRWPTQQDFIQDGLRLLKAFPFLDMILLLWDSEEEFGFKPDEKGHIEMPEICYGVHIHNSRVDILPPDAAWKLFCRYQLLYGEEPESYLSDYNEVYRKKWVDWDYMKRCLHANGWPEQAAKDSIFYYNSNIGMLNDPKGLEQDKKRYESLLEACRKMANQEKDVNFKQP